ncbi:glycosyltransferase [Roseibium sp. TrichSKD4]|uniref:glycosyltransferase family 4 protein n=1 Tax=Roseibium sp. TrichSKD4 TaxID=744980 RepID=UPI0001E56592|nr:glycosyltransferase family 4 protein [Roseibium sp. TrichSKD4]EFO33999.1 glycosyltransferase [Roseibium sp. TrichSKD4]
MTFREAGKTEASSGHKKLLFVVTEDWYFWSHRLPIARAASQAGWQVHVATRLADHRPRMEEEGFHVHAIDFHRSGLNPFRDIGTLISLVLLFSRLRPDLIHNIAAKPVLYGTMAAWLCRIPAVVNTMAGMGFLFSNENLKTHAARFLFMRALLMLGRQRGRNLILQNVDDRQMFLDAGLSDKHVSLIRGSGVDLEQYPASDEPDDTPVAICVSRLLRDKGIYELVEAARLLKQRGIALRIRLVGSSDLNPSSIPEATLSEWSAEGAVEIAGHSDRIADEYGRAHIAVLPSYREGLPKSLLEAAASGRPIVATDVPGCREICLENETGILVPARESVELAYALERLALDKKLRQRLGRQARSLVEAQFSEEVIVAQTLELYRSMESSA